MSTPENPVFAFGDFELDPRERRLLRLGTPVSLTPKVFDTLVLLVRNAGSVVSKDELMKAIWPRGYVDESNLVKHVWTIRRALGDSSAGQPFIETVPKLGYRFVAPVATLPRTDRTVQSSDDAPPAADAQTAPAAVLETTAVTKTEDTTVAEIQSSPPELPLAVPEPATPLPTGAPRPAAAAPRRFRLAVVAALVLLVVGGSLWAIALHSASPATGTRIAFVGFTNSSQDASAAWLAPALREMLGTEFGSASTLEIVPEDLVSDASKDLEPASARGYTASALARLRSRLNTDYVVSGSYLAATTADDRTLRVQIALQDARSGTLLATASNRAEVTGLRGVVADLGAQLRGPLGMPAPAAAVTTLVANAQPPTVEVARHVGVAIDALEHSDAARARDELLEAVAQAPDYAPAYAYLAQAWSALGYQQKSLAAAEHAARTAQNLPPEIVQRIRAALFTARYDWKQAATTWADLVRRRPQIVEYRLQLIPALAAAASLPAAQAALTELRQLPAAAGDPRVMLAAADLANKTNAPQLGLKQAQQALVEAKRRDAPGQIASAQYQVAVNQWHLGQLADAQALAQAAIDAYRALGNPYGEARGRLLLAGVLTDLHRSAEASAEHQHAMSLFQAIGDLRGVAGVYQHLGEVLWAAGDRDGAEVATRHALQMGRELGDLALQAWTLRALATIATDEAATDEAAAQYREANLLDERIGGPQSAAYGLGVYADVARLRGDLREATETCERARTAATHATDPQVPLSIALTCAQVSLDRGDIPAATAALEQVIKTSQTLTGFDLYRSNAEFTLAQIAIDAQRWADARALLVQASDTFVKVGSQTGEADAQAQLAMCEQLLAHPQARDIALSRARALRAAITSRQEIYPLEIALAEFAGTTGERSQAVDQLRGLAIDAERRHWISWTLEANVAAWRILVADHRDEAAETLRRDTEHLARIHGSGRILALLHAGAEAKST